MHPTSPLDARLDPIEEEILTWINRYEQVQFDPSEIDHPSGIQLLLSLVQSGKITLSTYLKMLYLV